MKRILIKSENITNKKYYLYFHINLEKDEIFYVGIGTNSRSNSYHRAYTMVGRNDFWNEYVLKLKSYKILIKEESDDYSIVKKLEILYIKQLRDSGCILTNIAAGGAGCLGYKHTKEHIESLKGNTYRKGIKHKPETIEYYKQTRKGSNSFLYGKSGFKSYTSTPVGLCDSNWNLVHKFGSTRDAAKFLNVDKESIRNAIKKLHFCKGYKVRNLTDEEIKFVQLCGL